MLHGTVRRFHSTDDAMTYDYGRGGPEYKTREQEFSRLPTRRETDSYDYRDSSPPPRSSGGRYDDRPRSGRDYDDRPPRRDRYERSPPPRESEVYDYKARSPPPRSRGDSPPPIKIVTGSKLYVGRVPPHTTSEDLAKLFGVYGFIGKIDMKPQGYAFIHYQQPLLADKVVEETGGTVAWKGIDFIIVVSQPREPRNSASGGSCFVCGGSNHWYISIFFLSLFCERWILESLALAILDENNEYALLWLSFWDMVIMMGSVAQAKKSFSTKRTGSLTQSFFCF